MPGRRPTARLYTEFDGDLKGTEDTPAQQANAYLARISALLNLDNRPDLEEYLRANDLVLSVKWRCRCKNGRNWRCNNATEKRGTQCTKCGEARKKRGKKYWAQRMVRDSMSKDRKCENCNAKLTKPISNRESKLKNWCQACCRRRQLLQMREFKSKYGYYKHDSAERRMINSSEHKDKERGFSWNEEDYIDVDFLKKQREKQKTKCYWCNIDMNPVHRKQRDGMTVERLTSEPHLKSNCVLACFSCNAKSYRYGWNPFPQYLSKILKIPNIDEKNYFSPKKRSSQWPNRLTINRWARLQEELLQKPLLA